ncbi:response regulator [Parendozoicomonas haliclonae]|nr:response regulator [Parendozoicomonas haliclonae]
MYKGLKNRVLRAGLIPVALLTITLCLLSGILAFFQTKADFEQQSLINSKQLALIISHSLSHNDKELTQTILRTSLQLKGMESLRITDEGDNALFESGIPMLPAIASPQTRSYVVDLDDHLLITVPVSTGESAPALWLEAGFNKQEILLSRYQWLLIIITISVLSLMLATIALLRLANSLSFPLERITSQIGQLDLYNLQMRLPADSNNDFVPLKRHLNHLLARMQIRYRDMKDEVERAAAEIQQNMETLELKNAELDISRKNAIEASQSKSMFLANISHEMHTPLNSIVGYCGLLEKTQLESLQREHLRTLQTSAECLKAIISDILDFSKIEAGKLHLEHAPFNLRTVVDEALAMNSPSAQEKKLELATVFYPGTPVFLLGDSNRLKQVISNLLSNAIKFTEQGSVAIEVNCIQKRNEMAELRISVKDTGIGISDTEGHKLFQAFSQVDSSLSRNRDGTGLGLVICKNLVAQMQGEIDFTSHAGEGSCFWFTANLAIDHKSEALHQSTRTDHLSGIAIVCEPREWSRLAIVRQLEDLGFEPHCLDTDSMFNSSRLSILKQASLFVVGVHQEDSQSTITEVAPYIDTNARLLLLGDPQHIEDLNYLTGTNTRILPFPLMQEQLLESLCTLFGEDQVDCTQKPEQTPQELSNDTRILAVDDNPPNLKLLKIMLEDLGVQVDTANSGYKAVEYAQQHDYDLIFMDIQMPGMNGVEACQKIRQQEQGEKNIPIIALTAHAMMDEKSRLLEEDFDAYLTKPVSEQQLLHTISHWTQPLSAGQTLSLFPGDSSADEKQQKAGTTSSSPVDMEEGITLAGGRKALAEELLSMILETLPENRESIAALHQQEHFVELQEVIHKLHGAARYCGVPDLRDACRESEILLKKKKLSELEDSIHVLNQEIDRLLIWQARFMPARQDKQTSHDTESIEELESQA